jgi:hypothetical protein
VITALIVLQVADLITTLYVLKRGGKELNPLLAGLQPYLGRDGAILAAKVGVVAVVLLIPMPQWVLAGLTLLYAAVVIHNVRQIVK